jgi:chromosomal replication initiation ATPase DnaA
MKPKIEDIINITSEITGVNESAILSRSRMRDEAEARFLIMRIAKERRHTLTKIGEQLDRDHTSIMHGIQKCESLCEIDASYLASYILINRQLNNNIKQEIRNV